MVLRKLKIDDADKMLEWMHDDSVCEFMQVDFQSKTIDDCKRFIKKSFEDNSDVHFAIADDNDEYMGTISLKDVRYDDGYAELGIIVRSKAMGKGFSSFAIKEIMNYAFNVLKLRRVIWCVNKFNVRANKFYVKNGYSLTENIPIDLKDKYSSENLIWYSESYDEYIEKSL